jgi:hypothetical protein
MHLDARHPRHANVRNQAGRAGDFAGSQKLFGRLVDARFPAQRQHEIAQGEANGFIVVDDRYNGRSFQGAAPNLAFNRTAALAAAASALSLTGYVKIAGNVKMTPHRHDVKIAGSSYVTQFQTL